MDIYHYDQITGAFVGAAVADRSPLDETWLIPAFATEIPPPETDAGDVAVFVDGAWSVLHDDRGTVYYLPDGTRGQISEIGETLPEGASLTPPPAPPRRVGTPREFLGLFTEAEKLAFFTAAGQVPALQLWWAEAATGAFSLDHPSVAEGLTALVAAGVIAEARTAEILGTDFDAVAG